jgi:hypothetical protein
MLLMGNFGQQLDIEEMRQIIESQQSRDMNQDQMIRALSKENGELQLVLMSLMQLLVKKGTLSQAEVQDIGRAIGN